MNAQAKLTVEGPQHKIASLAHHLKKLPTAKAHWTNWPSYIFPFGSFATTFALTSFALFTALFTWFFVLSPQKQSENKRVFFLPKSNLISSHWTEIFVNQNKGHLDLRDLNTYLEVVGATNMRCLEKGHGLMTWWCLFSDIFKMPQEYMQLHTDEFCVLRKPVSHKARPWMLAALKICVESTNKNAKHLPRRPYISPVFSCFSFRHVPRFW